MFGWRKDIMESGRSNIETPTVLAVWIVLTWSAVALFNIVYANVIANNIEKTILTNAISQQHSMMGIGRRGAEKFKLKSIHGMDMFVETSPQDHLFTLTLDLGQKAARERICNRLLSNQTQLQRSGSGLLLIAADGVAEKCPKDPKKVVYYFSTQPGSGTIPTASVSDCPQKVVVPKGGVYHGLSKTITCENGYEKQGDGCSVSCLKCADTPDKQCWNNQHCVPCQTICSDDRHCIEGEYCSNGYCCPNGLAWDAEKHKCVEIFQY
ncbi:MAG: hypothetical protein II942_00745 [Alphaproteobacteria bacterium]|nr:hypothetical protein [Alphaproteobacteria bacterium]